jgi:hypothetical protein
MTGSGSFRISVGAAVGDELLLGAAVGDDVVRVGVLGMAVGV